MDGCMHAHAAQISNHSLGLSNVFWITEVEGKVKVEKQL